MCLFQQTARNGRSRSFEDDKRFQAENYVLPQMEGIHMELHKKYDSDKKPHKRKKRQKIMPDTFQIIWKEKQRKIWKQKRCCKQQSTYHYLPNRGDYSYIISDF